MIFCPTCGSRAVPKDKRKENSMYLCTKTICGKVFRIKKTEVK